MLLKMLCCAPQSLFRLLEKRVQLPVRVQGPIGLRSREYPWLRYDVLVCIVGGIGVRLCSQHLKLQIAWPCHQPTRQQLDQCAYASS